MNPFRRIVAIAPLIGLLAVVSASMALACVWVWRVPIFQSPDEPLHYDYALSLHAKGGLFRATPQQESRLKALPPAPLYASFDIPGYYLHPHTKLLSEQAETETIAFNAAAKMRPDYGTPEYFEQIDRQAPPPQGIDIDARPSLMDCYPFGYYAVLAAWIAVLRQFGEGVAAVFFGARLLSVAMLGLNLTVIYGLLREMRFGQRFSLLVTAAVGCFPLTSFVASYVQPDNLSFLLVSLSFYLALVVRRREDSLRLIGLLGLALGGLLVTKPHYYVCVLVPIAAMLLSEAWRRPSLRVGALGKIAAFALPSLLLGGLHLWSTWNIDNYYAARATHDNTLVHTIGWLRLALLDFYSTKTHQSFFGTFGWMDAPLMMRGPRTQMVVSFALQGVTLLTIGLTLLRLEQVASRLACLAWRGRVRQAVQMACSNPVLNGYFLFTALMIVLYVRMENRFHAQGRNWLPFLLPIFLTLLVYAPKALSLRPVQRACSGALALGLAVYVVAGSYYSLKTIDARYYGSLHHQTVHETPLPLQLAAANQVTWSGRTANCEGTDPYLVFALPQPQHLQSVLLNFTLAHAAGDAPAQFQAWWLRQGYNDFAAPGHNVAFRLTTGPHEQTLTLWIDDTIDHLRIDPDVQSCRFELREVTLLSAQPISSPGVATPGLAARPGGRG